MIDLLTTAKYINQRYERTFHKPLDEMKLHKLLYFVQRESLLLFGTPLFPDQFEAWRYGPVMASLRGISLDSTDDVRTSHPELARYMAAFDSVFSLYAHKNSWSLSSISHGESCWTKAKEKESGSVPAKILTEDIRQDAEAIRIRRMLYA